MVVVGGGIAGLTAAHALRDRDVVVLEAGERAGGRILSEPRGEVWLNFGAHVFGGRESASGRLLEQLGVRVEPVPGRLAAVSLNGKLVSQRAGRELPAAAADAAALPRRAPPDGLKLRLAVRRYARSPRQAGEDPPPTASIGCSTSSTTGRSPRSPGRCPRTSTPSSARPDALLRRAGGARSGIRRRVLPSGLGSQGRAVAQYRRGLREWRSTRSPQRWETGSASGPPSPGSSARRTGCASPSAPDGVRRLEARAAVVATPAYATREIVAGLPADTAAALAAIPYGPYVVGAFLTRETAPMPWDDIYALATPKRSFSMLFNTANVLRSAGAPRAPGGSFMVYAAAGFARRLDSLGDDAVARTLPRGPPRRPAANEGHRRGGRDQAVGERAPVPAGRSRRHCRRR